MSRQISFLVVPLLSLGFLGCNGTSYNFNEVSKGVAEQNGGPTGPTDVIGQPTVTCSTQLNDLTVPAKVLFVVDTSGSNATENNNVGTDKMKTYRKGSIQKFFDDYSAKANFGWGFITFNYSSASSYIGDSWGTPSMFSTTANDMQSALNTFGNASDEGDTPYVAAIRKASDAIAQDISTGSKDTKYIVVFISDGLPSPSVENSVVNNEISQLMGKAPGRVSFNTIYYGNSSQAGQVLMQGMANVGGGQFLDTNAGMGRSFPISSVVQVPGTVCTHN